MRAVVALARNLGLEVVAEGVETVMQLDQLKALGCDQGQGYYFSKPIGEELATELIKNEERGAFLDISGPVTDGGSLAEITRSSIDSGVKIPA